MKLLLLAPHPFYQDRGTPIAVDLLLRVLSARGDHIDLVTYHEGCPVCYPNLRVHRILALPFMKNIPLGFSLKKLVCDVLMFVSVLRLAFTNRYDLVHSVEESVFMALVLRTFFGLSYIYDMDSSMSQQLVEKFPKLSAIRKIMEYFENHAIRKSEAVIPVCQALADIAEKQQAKKILLLPDISLLDDSVSKDFEDDIRHGHRIEGQILMYVGNLERYQGIDLLLESFEAALQKIPALALVIIGGTGGLIKHYQKKTVDLGISNLVYFLGPKPSDQLGEYLAQADILVSPRIQGNNTPMKVYSYLHSGKGLLATDLLTHTQVLDSEVALLATPTVEAFSNGMLALAENEALRTRLGTAGKLLAQEKYSFEAFRKKLTGLYADLEKKLLHQTVAS